MPRARERRRKPKCSDRQSRILPDRWFAPCPTAVFPKGTTTVARGFSLPSRGSCKTPSVADKRERLIDAFAGLRVQSTDWTNYYNVLTDTTCTEKCLVIQ